MGKFTRMEPPVRIEVEQRERQACVINGDPGAVGERVHGKDR